MAIEGTEQQIFLCLLKNSLSAPLVGHRCLFTYLAALRMFLLIVLKLLGFFFFLFCFYEVSVILDLLFSSTFNEIYWSLVCWIGRVCCFQTCMTFEIPLNSWVVRTNARVQKQIENVILDLKSRTFGAEFLLPKILQSGDFSVTYSRGMRWEAAWDW